ncbi:hypothetical protein RFI_38657 [Reticulomyxa filosa]|uniref:eRF1 domain-containing protein n=1 Tax=Reticulomyxa filosa TaxID=46433 RepID=X6LBV2_RETFI|nr:hypothetical protein RFI_38657 [Reticulomyxa filosa]|eukprot:ETN98830.1 hypothetical protein RFI_38657 [Reticulomyxa filosa]
MDFMQEIAKDTNKYCFGYRDTIRAMEMGALETCINKHPIMMKKEIYLTPKESQNSNDFLKDDSTGLIWEIVQQNDGCKLEFITDRSQEGSQFVDSFGGIGGIIIYVYIHYYTYFTLNKKFLCFSFSINGFLRYAINFAELEDIIDGDNDEEEAWI